MQSEPSSQAEPVGLCRCGHTSRTHTAATPNSFCTNLGCNCTAFLAQPVPTVINDRCKCSHDRFRHNWGSENDGACSKPDCDCKAYAPVTVETVELPESDDSDCTEDFRRARCCPRHTEDCPYVDPEPHECDNCNGCDPSTCMFNRPKAEAAKTACAVLHKDAEGNTVPCPDETSVEAYAEAVSEAVVRLKAEADVKPFKPYCRICGETHEPYMGCMQPMPQPERRPPLTVQYSVAGGHPYEVSIPGDASVTAEDGVLIVKHPSAQILAITRVAPMED